MPAEFFACWPDPSDPLGDPFRAAYFNIQPLNDFTMEKNYRIHSVPGIYIDTPAFVVQVQNVLGVWTDVKYFDDEDPDFSLREAEELLEILKQK